jgi:hypothetical protein
MEVASKLKTGYYGCPSQLAEDYVSEEVKYRVFRKECR